MPPLSILIRIQSAQPLPCGSPLQVKRQFLLTFNNDLHSTLTLGGGGSWIWKVGTLLKKLRTKRRIYLRQKKADDLLGSKEAPKTHLWRT
jgi:hypothetical protein